MNKISTVEEVNEVRREKTKPRGPEGQRRRERQILAAGNLLVSHDSAFALLL